MGGPTSKGREGRGRPSFNGREGGLLIRGGKRAETEREGKGIAPPKVKVSTINIKHWPQAALRRLN